MKGILTFSRNCSQDGCDKITRSTTACNEVPKVNVNCVLFYVFVVLFMKSGPKNVYYVFDIG